MASRADLLNTYMDAAIAALATGDYGTAINKTLAAQGIAATLPKATRGLGPGGGTQGVEWHPEALDAFLIRVRQAQSASGGVSVSNNQYVNADPLAQNVSSENIGDFPYPND